MLQDSGIPLKSIQVDGGMTANSLLMQLQADLMGIDVGKGSFTLSLHESQQSIDAATGRFDVYRCR